MIEFTLPSLGADMDQGKLVEWKVRSGDTVRRGQVVATVETAKANIDFEIWHDGTIQELIVQPGQTVPVGTVLATLLAPGETAGGVCGAEAPAVAEAAEAAKLVSEAAAEISGEPAPAPMSEPAQALAESSPSAPVPEPAQAPTPAPTPEPAPAPAPEPAAQPAPATEPAAAPARHVRVSPVARRHAEDAGIDVDTIAGTGPDGAVMLEDVERAIAAKAEKPQHAAPEEHRAAPPQPQPPQAAPPQAAPPQAAPPPSPPQAAQPDRAAEMRKAIAAAMSRSKREIPHYYLSESVPMKKAQQWLLAANEGRPITERLLMAVLQLKAVALAARKFPEMNGFYTDGVYKPSPAVHVGVAISLRQGGLIAPAIHDVADKPLEQLMRDLSDLVRRTRAGSLRSSELSDPTITVTNLGDQGVDATYGIIYPPQVALVGFGRIAERPWAENGMIGALPVTTATLAADHRVSDGHPGGLFLAAIRDLLQRPEEL